MIVSWGRIEKIGFGDGVQSMGNVCFSLTQMSNLGLWRDVSKNKNPRQGRGLSLSLSPCWSGGGLSYVGVASVPVRSPAAVFEEQGLFDILARFCIRFVVTVDGVLWQRLAHTLHFPVRHGFHHFSLSRQHAGECFDGFFFALLGGPNQ